jgi:hypothetical protein
VEAAKAFDKAMRAPPPNPKTGSGNQRMIAVQRFERALEKAGIDLGKADVGDIADAARHALRFTRNLTSVVQAAGQADTASWVEQMGKNMKGHGYENLAEVLTLANLAGRDNTIASARIKYYDQEYVLKGAGAQQHPQQVIDRLLDPHTYVAPAPSPD